MPNPNKDKKSYNPKKVFADPSFQAWYKFYTPEGLAGIAPDAVKDYDYASYYGSGDYKNYQGFGHFPDTYKTPQHETFSNESIYSIPENPGGKWNEDQFNPKGDFQYQNGGTMKKNKKCADGGMFPSQVKKVTKKQGLLTTTEEVPLNLGYGMQDIQPLYPNSATPNIPTPQFIPNPKKKKDQNSVTYEALQRGGKDIYSPVFHGDWTDKAKMNFYNSSPDNMYGNQILKGDSLSNITPSSQQSPKQLPEYVFPHQPDIYRPTFDMWGNDNQNYLPLLQNGGEIEEAKSGFKLNPEHKGDCTPMSKSTCTGKKKQFAINAKNHFKKMPDGGDIAPMIPTPTKRSISYETLQRPDHTTMYAPVFNGDWSYNDVKNAWNTIPDNFSGSPVVRGDAWNALYEGVKPNTTSSQWKRIATQDKIKMLNPNNGSMPRSGAWNIVNDHYEDDNGPKMTEGMLNASAIAKMPYGGSFNPYDFSGYDRQPWQDMPDLQPIGDKPIQTQAATPQLQYTQPEVTTPELSPFQNNSKQKKSGSGFTTPGTGDLLAAGLQMAANLLPEHEQSNMYHKRNFGGYNPNMYGTGSSAIYKNGGSIGYLEGEVYDLSESEINNLIKKGYKIQHV